MQNLKFKIFWLLKPNYQNCQIIQTSRIKNDKDFINCKLKRMFQFDLFKIIIIFCIGDQWERTNLTKNHTINLIR